MPEITTIGRAPRPVLSPSLTGAVVAQAEPTKEYSMPVPSPDDGTAETPLTKPAG